MSGWGVCGERLSGAQQATAITAASIFHRIDTVGSGKPAYALLLVLFAEGIAFEEAVARHLRLSFCSCSYGLVRI